MADTHSIDDVVSAIGELAKADRRLIVGIVGPPGAGKSTIAEAVVERLNRGEQSERQPAALLPMDGFHLPQARLVELGRRERMGAPDTFDIGGFLATLTALRGTGDRNVRRSGPDIGSVAGRSTVLAPGFDRTVEEAIPDAITIGPERSIVVVEGNYLLLNDHGWDAVLPLIDVSFFVRVDRGIRLTRLIDRHVRFGKSREAAEAWALGPDEANARLIDATVQRADHVIEL